MPDRTTTDAILPPLTKLHLEDHGQDFLWFIVDGDLVKETGPFQGWHWNGKRLQPPKKWRKGSRVVWADGTMLRYPVESVERVAP